MGGLTLVVSVVFELLVLLGRLAPHTVGCCPPPPPGECKARSHVQTLLGHLEEVKVGPKNTCIWRKKRTPELTPRSEGNGTFPPIPPLGPSPTDSCL